MISKEELENYAKTKGWKNLGFAEIDYFQNILLFILSQNFGSNLTFKGGTALSKCYGLPRFSEDLDFTAKEEINENTLYEGLRRFKIEFENEVKKFQNSRRITIKIRGPLYIGTKQSQCRVIIDVSLRELVIIKPILKTIGRFMEEIPSFDVLVMDKKEIFSEKIRAIITRNKARDLYDLFYLAKEQDYFDEKLVNEKLKYYEKKFNKKEFFKSLVDKESIWKAELTPLVSNVPSFKEVSSFIKNKIK